MFHDYKFFKNAFCKNVFCKSALLNSTSFSPFTYWQKLLNASELLSASKQSKKHKLKAEVSITPLLAALLAACGSDNGNVTVGGNTDSQSFDFYVLDGTIEGARVYVDENDNGEIDTNEPLIGTTDENGRVSIEAEYAGATFLIDASGALDLFTGVRLPDDIFYKAISDERGGLDVVASPISTLIEALRDSDPQLTDEAILELIFGEGTQVDMDDLNNPDNYILPTDETPQPADSPIAIAEQIAEISIQLQVLIEQENGNLALVLPAVTDGFVAAADLSDVQDVVNARIAEARQRAGGEPIANPKIGVEATANNDLTLGVNVWGFRDPGGNVNGDIVSSFTRLDIVSITDGSTTDIRGVLVASDGTEYGAGDEIPSAQLENLIFRPAADYSGPVQIAYMVFDGEDSSDVASLEIIVNIFIVDDYPDDTPVFTSETNITVDENTDANTDPHSRGSATSIYQAEIEENSAHLSVSYSLLDATDFGITSDTGNVWFRAPPDYETQSSYSFTVVVRVTVDGACDLTANHVVAVTIADLDETPNNGETDTDLVAGRGDLMTEFEATCDVLLEDTLGLDII